MKTFRANGKFLLTGEYLVLQGVTALALPLKYGQTLEVKTLELANNMIHWDAFTPKGLWFSAMLDKHDFSIRACDDLPKAERLQQIFKAIKSLNANILQEKNDYAFTTRLEFDTEWGLGSSSTLISILSQWANVNTYKILDMTMGGSGYDIACATASKPLTYRLENGNPVVHEIDFRPAFAENLYFVYQGHKQSSGREVKSFKERAKTHDFSKEIAEISKITEEIINLTSSCDDAHKSFERFCQLIDNHENIISHCIGQEPLGKHFADFPGTVKSLGAWGGDFFLAASNLPEKEIKSYFQKQGLDIVIRYNDIVFKI